MNIGKSGDEFRPITQRGRMNKINQVPCCGKCNSSKQDKCGDRLIKWINENDNIPTTRKTEIMEWFETYEKYMMIPYDQPDNLKDRTYEDMHASLDNDLNLIYNHFI